MNIKDITLIKHSKIFIAERNNLNSEEFLDIVAQKLNSGFNIIIYSITTENDRIFLENSIKIHQLTSIFNALFLIKSRVDILKLIDCDGILLDKNSIEINYIKKIIDNEKLIGYHLESNEEIELNHFDFIISKEITKHKLNYILKENTGELNEYNK